MEATQIQSEANVATDTGDCDQVQALPCPWSPDTLVTHTIAASPVLALTVYSTITLVLWYC